MGRHVRASARDAAAAAHVSVPGRAREHPRGVDDLLGVEPRAFGGVFRGEVGDPVREFGRPRNVRFTEGLIEALLA